MADTLQTQAPQDENETNVAPCAQLQRDGPSSAAVIPTGEVPTPDAEELPGKFLQLPTFSITPATPPPPSLINNEDLDDSLIEGLFGSDANSLSAPSLGKVSSMDCDPLELSEVLKGDIPKPGLDNNMDKLPGALESLSKIVDSTNVSLDKNESVTGCVEGSQKTKSPIKDLKTQSESEETSKTLEKLSVAGPPDSQDNLEDDGPSSVVKGKMGDGFKDKETDPLLVEEEEVQVKDKGVVEKHVKSSVGNATVETESSRMTSEGIFQKRIPEESCEVNAVPLRPEFVELPEQEKLMETSNSDWEKSSTTEQLDQSSMNDMPGDLPSSSEDPLSLTDVLSNQLSGCNDENSLLPKDLGTVLEAPDASMEGTSSNGEAVIVSLDSVAVGQKSPLSLQHQCEETEPMDVDEGMGVDKSGEHSEDIDKNHLVNDNNKSETSDESANCKMAFSVVDKGEAMNETLKVSEICKPSSVLLNDVEEPLQPVTIGGSLQPLEEVQEASILNDPSFTADLSLIDSSADEADSIGGLVINSVIGAADGVADFPPDDEMETDKQLTDISLSAPRMVEESCEIDSIDDDAPLAKRRRLENGESEIDEKLEDAKKVIMKVAPIKNGHGMWDSMKLSEILLSKGTIHVRIHASSVEAENFDFDKCEIEVDLTCIMISAVEEENYQVLGIPTHEPDGDVCDPLALGMNQVEQQSPPHYSRPFAPPNRGRSTALQPAMPRPYRQLQSPPHVYNKNEVLGLPQQLEFEDSQMGSTEWAGKEYYAGLLLQRKAPPTLTQHYPVSSAQHLPARGRKRGRPPLTGGRRIFSPIGTPVKTSPSKTKSQGSKNLPEPIKFRPPTPPQHLLISSLLKLNKPTIANKNDNKKKSVGEPPNESKGKVLNVGCKDDDDTVSVSQSPMKRQEDSKNTKASGKTLMLKLSCEFCDLVFRKRASLTAHVRTKHRSLQKCPICSVNVKVKNKYGMRFHILRAHKNQPTFHCGKCGESFRLKHHLMNHERLKHELLESDNDDDNDESKLVEDQDDKLCKKLWESVKAEEQREQGNDEKDKFEKFRDSERLCENSFTDGVELSESVEKSVSKETSNNEKKDLVFNNAVVKEKSEPKKLISRGKVMNVRPPSKVSSPKSKLETDHPSQRITRSSSQTGMDSDNESSESGSGSDDGEDDDDDDDDDDESTTSSSDVEILEKGGHVCDICSKGFTHQFKLKHHIKSEHSKAAKSMKLMADKRKVSDAEPGEGEQDEDGEEDEDDSEEADEDMTDDEEEEEEEDLNKRKKRKEKERREKEISLTCSTCNKVCRSEYQLKLHLPTHTIAKSRRKVGVRKLLSVSKSSTKPMEDEEDEEEDDEEEEEEEEEQPSKKPKGRRGKAFRVLRSADSSQRGERTGATQKRASLNQKKVLHLKGRQRTESSGFRPRKRSTSKKVADSDSDEKSDERPAFIQKVGHVFTCTKCNISFGKEKSMTYHLKKIHETIYPFKACEHCGKVFRSCGPYNRHLLQHKVHYCPEGNCKAKFRKMLRLKQHQKNAHSNKKHRCPKCVALFAKSSELDRHYEAKHPKQPSDDDDDDDEEESSEEEEAEKELIREPKSRLKGVSYDKKRNSNVGGQKDWGNDRRKCMEIGGQKGSVSDRRRIVSDLSGHRDRENDRRRRSSEVMGKMDSSDCKKRNVDNDKKNRTYLRRKSELLSPPKEVKQEKGTGSRLEEMVIPLKRKARCVPISYKEPEDEEDLGTLQKVVAMKQVAMKQVAMKQVRDTRNSRERCSISNEVKLAYEKKVPPEIKTVSMIDSSKRTRLKSVDEGLGGNIKKDDKIPVERIVKKKSVLKLRSRPMDSSLKSKPMISSLKRKHLDSSLKSRSMDSSLKSRSMDSSLKSRSMDSSLKSRSMDSSLKSRSMDSSLKSRPMDSSLKSRPMDSSLKSRPMDSSLKSRPMDPSLKSRPMDPSLKSRPMDPSLNSRPMDSSLKARLSKILSPPKNDRISPKVNSKSSHSPLKNKKTKVTLSWTAALKAQIRAAEAAEAKGETVKKKKKPSSEKQGTKAVVKSPSKAGVKSSTKNTSKSTSAGKSSKARVTSSSGFPSLNSSHEFLHQHDMSYPAYLVGDDSMFSLDDNSQMDIIGDYYGSQYPPSEEISDFVPDDDESGPAKIIGFDSF